MKIAVSFFLALLLAGSLVVGAPLCLLKKIKLSRRGVIP
jgi:hypothetical protein